MLDHDSLDDIRRQIQESLAESKKERLRDEFGMLQDYTNPNLSPEAHNDFLDYILEFERQFENATRIFVRDRIGNPTIPPVEEIPLHALEEAVDKLLELLFVNGVAVDFMGDWDDEGVYRYITEQLLDEEMDDIRIEGMFCNFAATTPEYDVQLWVEIFVTDVFRQESMYFLPGLESQPLFDMSGRPISASDFGRKVEAVWARLPVIDRFGVEPVATQVAGDEGSVTAVVTWQIGDDLKEVESFFRLQPSPYTGWDVVQTSLLDDLLAVLE